MDRSQASSPVRRSVILIVEDEPAMAQFLHDVLIEEEFEAVVEGRGDTALQTAVQRHPDAIILDLALPGLDGLDVCRELRQKGVQVPVIALTARDTVPDRVLGLDAGADDYLVKPFAIEELLARLRSQLRRGHRPPERLQVGVLVLEPATRLVRRGHRDIELTDRARSRGDQPGGRADAAGRGDSGAERADRRHFWGHVHQLRLRPVSGKRAPAGPSRMTGGTAVSPAGRPGIRAARAVMGMPVTIDVRDPEVSALTIEQAYADLRMVDSVLSPRADSEVSRINRGELRADDGSPLLRQVVELCGHYGRATGGSFSCWLEGRFDPRGLVKGLAMDRACSILERHGARNFLVDAGGDVVARGHSGAGAPWRVGIRHPVERSRVVRVVQARDLCVATSGTYEKGSHILDPQTGLPATELISLTVVGPDILEADVHATAAFVRSRAGLALIERLPGYEAYAIEPDLRAAWTPGFDSLCDTSP